MTITNYRKVCKTIDSCNTYQQVKVAGKMIEAFKASHVLSVENTVIMRLRSRMEAREHNIRNIFKPINITIHPLQIQI